MNEATTVTENATPAAAAPEPGPGAALQEERRRQSLSLTDVARQLKLAPRQVEALERDDFAALPGPVFVRGFLRNYARLLGLDPEPMVRAVDRLMAPHTIESEAKASASLERGAAVPIVESAAGESRSRWPVYLIGAAVILVTGYLATRDRTPQPASVDVPVGVARPRPRPNRRRSRCRPPPRRPRLHLSRLPHRHRRRRSPSRPQSRRHRRLHPRQRRRRPPRPLPPRRRCVPSATPDLQSA